MYHLTYYIHVLKLKLATGRSSFDLREVYKNVWNIQDLSSIPTQDDWLLNNAYLTYISYCTFDWLEVYAFYQFIRVYMHFLITVFIGLKQTHYNFS